MLQPFRLPLLVALLLLGFSGASLAAEHPSFAILDTGVGVFAVRDGASLDVWRSDGTPRGTFRLTNQLCTGSCERANLLTLPWGIAGNRAFFLVQDEHGRSELWVTDGSRNGTFAVIAGAGPDFPRETSPLWVRSLGLFFFLAGSSEDGYDLWRSDGTSEGTFQIEELDPRGESAVIRELTEFRGRAFFSARDQRGQALWTSDGTAPGTVLVRDPVRNETAHAGPSWLRATGSRLFFFFPTPGAGIELWVSDGTRAGSRPVADLVPGPESPEVFDAQAVGGRLFLSVRTERGLRLWVSDGTRSVALPLPSLNEPPQLSHQPLFKGRYYFTVLDTFNGYEIWSTDGTRAGTRRLADLCPQRCAGVVPASLKVVGNRLLFINNDTVHGVELWQSDGTAQGTRLVRDLCPGPCSSSPWVYRAGDRIVLSAANAPSAPRQLWWTDGVSRMVRLTNLAGSIVDGLTGELPGALLFRVVSPSGPDQLWVSDGTRPGTRLLKTFETAPASLSPLPWIGSLRQTIPGRGGSVGGVEQGAPVPGRS